MAKKQQQKTLILWLLIVSLNNIKLEDKKKIEFFPPSVPFSYVSL